MSSIRPGVRIAIDWGKARIGVAACDRDGVLCHPVTTVRNDPSLWKNLRLIIDEHQPMEIVLGMPIDLRGQEGQAARDMGVVADKLSRRFKIDLRVVDERLSTAAASRKLPTMSAQQRRTIIDQAAAVAILEQALETERITGQPAGNLWTRKGN